MKILIDYFFTETEEYENLPFEQKKELNEKAEEYIFSVMGEYYCGELCESIEEQTFYGWFSTKNINN